MSSFILFRGACDPASAVIVRRRLRELRSVLAVGSPLVEDLELAATELVTNAVRAGAATLTVEVTHAPPRVDLRVTDDGPGEPLVRTASVTDESGRGLQILAALAEDWGFNRRSGGKTVWARFAAGPGLAASPG